jgi:type I restriction enzyme R subunit
LSAAIANYNLLFKSNFTIDTKGFDNYYKDIAKRVKGFDENNDPIPRQDQVDLLIVVGMFLTGFDAALVNTLFVDKPLCYHGLIQAYSRTNRIYNDTKCFGNIVTFRDLEQATKDAIALFGYKDPKSMVSEKSYKDSIDSFIDVLHDLIRSFPDPSAIETESQKKEFIQLFGKYMRQENRLQNYDEFVALKALQNVDKNDAQALEDFKNEYHITDDDLAAMQTIKMLDERTIQDYRSTYNDIRDSLHREKMADENNQSSIWDDVVFEVELLKSQEINLDYILEQIFYHKHSIQDKPKLVENVRRMIRASLSNRAKEDLVVEFIDQADLIPMTDAPSLMEAFYSYAHQQQEIEAQAIMSAENLNVDEAKRYIALSLKRGFASDHGMELHAILPKMSPISSQYQAKKQSVFEKISAFVEKFK